MSTTPIVPDHANVVSSPRRGVLRAQVLRATAAKSPIPPHIYHAISLHLDDAFASGKYLKDGPLKPGEAPPTAPNILTDPSAMDGMMAGMKTQMVMMVPQMVIMGWINFFFQGFVLSEFFRRLYISPYTPGTSPPFVPRCGARYRRIRFLFFLIRIPSSAWASANKNVHVNSPCLFHIVKLPFPLTLGFKSMLQRGIETPDMDVRWVSSLSWYFLNFFGLNGLYRLILGSDNCTFRSGEFLPRSVITHALSFHLTLILHPLYTRLRSKSTHTDLSTGAF